MIHWQSFNKLLFSIARIFWMFISSLKMSYRVDSLTVSSQRGQSTETTQIHTIPDMDTTQWICRHRRFLSHGSILSNHPQWYMLSNRTRLSHRTNPNKKKEIETSVDSSKSISTDVSENFFSNLIIIAKCIKERNCDTPQFPIILYYPWFHGRIIRIHVRKEPVHIWALSWDNLRVHQLYYWIWSEM